MRIETYRHVSSRGRRNGGTILRYGVPVLALAVSAMAARGAPNTATVVVEVDNFASVYYGNCDGTNLTAISAAATTGPNNGAATYLFDICCDKCLFVAAWSDDGVAQGLLVDAQVNGTVVSASGDATRWQVYATGQNLNLATQQPSTATMTAQIALANNNNGLAGSSVGWSPIAIGGVNGPYLVFNFVPGYSAGSRWMWYNSGAGALPIPFQPGANHREFLIFRTQLSGPCVKPPSGQIAWWPLDETVPFVSHDVILGHHGVQKNGPPVVANNVGPMPVAGHDGLALRFDGINDYVSVPHATDLNLLADIMTMEAVVFMPTGSTGGPIIDKFIPMGFFFGIDSLGFPTMLIEDDTTRWIADATDIVPFDAWTCIAATVAPATGGGVNICFYINGVQKGCFFRNVNTSFINNSNPLSIGGSPSLGAFFSGRIDEVSLYNRVLTQTEIADNCCRHKCKCACPFKTKIADIVPCPCGDGVVDLSDILAILAAFSGVDPCP